MYIYECFSQFFFWSNFLDPRTLVKCCSLEDISDYVLSLLPGIQVQHFLDL